MARVRAHGTRLSAYDFGRTTVYACRMDPRFSYSAYVPDDYDEHGSDSYRLLVAVHGTLRDMTPYREAFIPFAERHRCIVLAPLFPAGIESQTDVSSYKMLTPGSVRYDLVLLSMIDEIKARYRIGGDRFAMFGFSGGGHFAHRFLYLHPERISAVSIGAPGVVTLLDFERDFWVGVRNIEQVMGRPINLEAMRRAAVQMVIGADDTETWEIAIPPGSPAWRPDGDIAGANRHDRMRSLKASFENHGITVRHDIVPGVGHRSSGIFPAVEAFLNDATAGWPAG
ncbi:alpha/beta hydrolase [Phreatobacter stygius]|uniref:Alpha/beta hydrolase n=1 Tax=Phreatobacter stygius TaxID=1940610 RepID=A0A4D7AYZ2_9HYPH|nr:alpha/beta hydrolase [Phreatobacter stygius]QCI64013.1 alpha/beta hydrolase [Phreatobacter stygius]